MRFLIGVAEQFAVVAAANEDAHFVVVDLAELVEVEAGDNGQLFVEIALGVQVLAEAGAHVGQLAQPADFLRLKLALAVDDAHVDLQPVLVGQQLLDAVVELEVGADEDQPVLGVLDQLFEEVIRRTGV